MEVKPNSHEFYMSEALKEAIRAVDDGEVPIGAVVVSKKMIIARSYNQVERLHDSTAHAEMLAITTAMEYLSAKYLKDCTLYVTLEPCLMCASAMGHAHLKGLIFGASDLQNGFYKIDQQISSANGAGSKILHPKTKIIQGIMKDECKRLLDEFFLKKRAK